MTPWARFQHASAHHGAAPSSPQVGARDAIGTGSSLPPRNEKVIRAGLGIIFEHLENGLWAPGQPIFLSRGRVTATDDH